jgi:hypothetical protein
MFRHGISIGSFRCFANAVYTFLLHPIRDAHGMQWLHLVLSSLFLYVEMNQISMQLMAAYGSVHQVTKESH